MRIGVPRERKTLEKRVALTPDGARELTKLGHDVIVEKGAGDGSFFSDYDYKEAGCVISTSLKEVWESELLVKVKEPHEDELEFMRKGQILFDYLHLAGLPRLATAVLESGITAIAYELVQTPSGRLPLLEPMSEIAGKLSVINGAHFLQSHHGGRGQLLGGAVGVNPGTVVIIGAGISGRAACSVALGLGAQVTVLDIDSSKLERITTDFDHRAVTLYSTRASLERACKEADLLIGAVLIPGAAAPRLVTRSMIQSMKKGAVVVDISIDQGGCIETIRPTSLEKPTFLENDVIHYGVQNMPAQTPRTSTLALTSATLPYIVRLAEGGMSAALQDRDLKGALTCHEGKITHDIVRISLADS
jgi:alanine dehydrogenase